MRAAEGAELHGAAGEIAYLADRLGGLARLGERALGVRAQQAAGLGEGQTPPRAGEERDAQLGLEPADLLREARLREVQLFRRCRERPARRSGQKVGELLKRYRFFLRIPKLIKYTPMAKQRRY
jgi:hypothetical protein